VFGFIPPIADPPKANAELTEILATWTDFFLKRKFVNGDSLSIADYRVAPFLFSLCQPGIDKMVGFKPSPRVQKYSTDFQAACGAAGFLTSADGFSVAEYLASKTADAQGGESFPAGALVIDFDIGGGVVKSIGFTKKPLGIVFDEKKPVVVKKFNANGSAQQLGVQVGWIFKRIDGTDLENLSGKECKELLVKGSQNLSS
jgi:hypothetical protein